MIFWCFLHFYSSLAFAVMPSDPVTDPHFLELPDGSLLSSLKVQGLPLTLTKGSGGNFSASEEAAFEKLKQDSKASVDHPVQWLMLDLGNHQVIDQSAAPDRNIFGASVAKVFVASTLLDHQGGQLEKSQWPLLADMLVVSSNSAWVELQKQIGGGNDDRGRERVQAFTQRMGYSKTKGFQGSLGQVHGNELNAHDLAEFLYDTYHAHYAGAETVWKVMHTLRTGRHRGFKYIPSNIFVAGKTGTYDGPSINPETGGTTNPDGSPYKVRVRHQLIVLHTQGRHYGLAILANTGLDESAALLAGGLFHQVSAP